MARTTWEGPRRLGHASVRVDVARPRAGEAGRSRRPVRTRSSRSGTPRRRCGARGGGRDGTGTGSCGRLDEARCRPGPTTPRTRPARRRCAPAPGAAPCPLRRGRGRLLSHGLEPPRQVGQGNLARCAPRLPGVGAARDVRTGRADHEPAVTLDVESRSDRPARDDGARVAEVEVLAAAPGERLDGVRQLGRGWPPGRRATLPRRGGGRRRAPPARRRRR